MSKADLAWLPLYIDDYRSDTNGRPAEFHGAYLLLIMHYWLAGPLPDNDARLALIAASTPERWAALRPDIEAFFHIKDGLWRHKRIERELAKAKTITTERSKAGKRGAAKRWASRKSEMANRWQTPWQTDAPKEVRTERPIQGRDTLDQTSYPLSTDSIDGKVVRLPLPGRRTADGSGQ